MIVIRDTSAITSLLQIGRLDILPALYREVVIPTEVATELKRFHATLPAFIRVLPVTNRAQFEKLQAELDDGEAAAITLMLEGKGDVLLIDERRGRLVAVREGLLVVGVVGVLLEARRRGHIPSLTDALEQLEKVAGFRLSSQLKLRALQAVGET